MSSLSSLTSPTKLTDQKPFRGFDITSLIRKDDDYKPKRPAESRSPPTSSPGSPNVTVGPPMSPPSNPYANLFNSGLYQQYLGHLIANSANGGGAPPINPMLLQAQLAMAAQSNHAHLLANYNGSASSLISERLKQNRYSPYPPAAMPNSLTHPSLISPPGLGSAFKSLSRHPLSSSPPVSPPHSVSPPPARSPGSIGSPGTVKSEPDLEPGPIGTAAVGSSAVAASDIKNIEKMISGLSGNSEGTRFSLSHENRIS